MRTFMSWLGAAVLAIAAHAQDFTQTMTAEERAAAGLERLSPAELAKLKAAVERYKAGAIAIVEQQAEKKVAATEARAKEAEQKAAAHGADSSKKGPSWLAALITLEKSAKAPESNEEFRARLKGKLESFNGRRTFTLDNGQVWQMIDVGSWSGPEYENPEVSIKPGMMGVFWLRVPEASLRVKVKPLRLQ